MEERILFKEEIYRIIGVCFEVYKEKGSGFVEAVCQECLAIELANQGIPFVEVSSDILVPGSEHA